MTEAQLQGKIIKDLRLKGWVVTKIMKTSMAGWTDLQAHRDKVTIFIETKVRGKDAKPLQKYVHRILREQGFEVFVIDTWESYLSIRF